MYNKILVAPDTCNPAVFESALTLATATGADLLLLHVLNERDPISPASLTTIAWDYSTPLAEETWKIYQEQWKAYVEKSLARLHDCKQQAEAAGVICDIIQIRNEPGRGICSTAKTADADLIVIGTHQRKGMKELFMGSVSNYVMHHAPCSVMLVSLSSEPAESLLETSAMAHQVA